MFNGILSNSNIKGTRFITCVLSGIDQDKLLVERSYSGENHHLRDLSESTDSEFIVTVFFELLFRVNQTS